MGDQETVEGILETVSYIRLFVNHQSLLKLGVRFTTSEISFDKAVMFSWILEEYKK